MTATKVFDDIYLVGSDAELVALAEQLNTDISYHIDLDVHYPSLVDTRGLWQIFPIYKHISAPKDQGTVVTRYAKLGIGVGTREGCTNLNVQLLPGDSVTAIRIKTIGLVHKQNESYTSIDVNYPGSFDISDKFTAIYSVHVPTLDICIPLWFKCIYRNGVFRAAKLKEDVERLPLELQQKYNDSGLCLVEATLELTITTPTKG